MRSPLTYEMAIKNNNIYLQYFIVIYMIAISGFPFFTGDFHLFLYFIIMVVAFLYTDSKFTNNFIGFLFFFAFFFLMQGIWLVQFALNPTIAFFVRIISAFMAVQLLGYDFFKKFISVMGVLATISLLFYFCIILIPSFYGILDNLYYRLLADISYEGSNHNVIFYTFDNWIYYDIPRNAGPIWEPGAFGMFLSFALFFNLLHRVNLFSKRNILFILTIITTFSLAAYFSLLMIILFYLIILKRKLITLLFVPFIIIASYAAFINYEFLGEKFEYRYEKYQNVRGETSYEHYNYRLSRFNSTELDLHTVYNNPIFGIGLGSNIAILRDTNTFTSTLRKYGLLGGGILFFLVFMSIKRIIIEHFNFSIRRIYYSSFLLIIFFTLSQSFFNSQIFLFLLLFSLYQCTISSHLKNIYNDV